MSLPRRDVLIVATGGQGEARAALARIAFGEHKIKLTEGDTVVFSSRQIPGNELDIGRIMNALARSDVKTVTERQAHVHVSGTRHAGARRHVSLDPSENLIPVHGETRHLHEHRRFGLEQGIPKAMVQENGDVVRLAPDGPAKIGDQQVGRLVLDGDVILPADGTTMNERPPHRGERHHRVAVPIDRNGRLAGDVAVTLDGVPVEEDRDAFLARAAAAAQEAVRGAGADEAKLTEAVRLAVRRSATEYTGKKPIVRVMILRV
jgi:ribonuclease J